MKRLVKMGGALLVCAALAFAQPKPKSQKEVDAIKADLQHAQTPDARIAAVENLVTKFADTEFKAIALRAAAEAAQQKGDYHADDRLRRARPRGRPQGLRVDADDFHLRWRRRPANSISTRKRS